MVLIVQISPTDFIDQVRVWGADGTNKVDKIDLGEFFSFYLALPRLSKVYATIIPKSEYTGAIALNLEKSTISAIGLIEVENDSLQMIRQEILKLGESNAEE